MSKIRPRTFRRLLGYLRPYRGRFLMALAAMSLFGLTDGAVPLLIRSVLDDIFGARNEQMLLLLPIVLIIFAVVRGTCGFLQQYLATSVGLAITQDLRNEIAAKLLTLSPRFFSKNTSGALITRVTNDTLLVRMALTESVAAALRDSIRVIALLSAALYLDPVLAAIAFIGFPLGLWPVLRFGKKVRKLSKVGQDQFGGLTSILQESIVGHRVVQAFSMEDFERRRFARENERLTETFKRAAKYGALSQPTNELIASVAIAIVIVYGGYSVINNVRTQGDFIAFLAALFLLYEPLKKIGRSNTTFQTGVAAAERIFEVLDEKPEIADSPGAVTLELPQDFAIEFNGVSFSYREIPEQAEGQFALRDVNLRVQAGETLALVGMSGGGKSTIVSLLARFYDPVTGSISIAGKDIRDVTVASLRRSIALVSQHTFLFNDSVYNNILYGRPEASAEEVYAAARAANAHEFIEKLPEGYRTVIGEQGYSLSGGERQRLAIARALLRNAPILILDEATASLDSESEKLVQEAIDNLIAGRTVFVIAHRLATVRSADNIAVVVRGRVVEYGPHDNLLALGGEYAKLHRLQFSGQSPATETPAAGGWI